MKRPVLTLTLLLACGSVLAGVLLQKPVLHLMKHVAPGQAPPTVAPAHSGLTPVQASRILQSAGGTGTLSVSTTISLDARALWASNGDCLVPSYAVQVSPPTDSIYMKTIAGNSLAASHFTQSGTPFMIDFQVSPSGIPGQPATVVSTGPDGSTTTWPITGTTNVSLAYFPSGPGSFGGSIQVTAGEIVVTGVTILATGP